MKTTLGRIQEIWSSFFEDANFANLDEMDRRKLAMAIEIDFKIDLPANVEDTWSKMDDIAKSVKEARE